MDTQDSHVSFIRGLIEAARFNLEMLERIEAEATARSSNDPKAVLHERAMALYYSRNDEAAVAALNALVSVSQTADGYATLAQALFRAGRDEDALRAAKTAIDLDGSAHTGYQVAAAVLLKSGDLEAAHDYARQAASHASDPRNQVLLAMIENGRKAAVDHSAQPHIPREVSWLLATTHTIGAGQWPDLDHALPLALAAEPMR